MDNLINKMLGSTKQREDLFEKTAKHQAIVRAKFAEKAAKIAEGKLPQIDKESPDKETSRKTLLEAPDSNFNLRKKDDDDFERKPEDAPEDKIEGEPEDNDADVEEKEYFGNKGEIFYYLTHETEEGEPALRVVDAEGEVVYTPEEGDDGEDVLTFLIAAVKDIVPENVSTDIFIKYVIPALEEEKPEDEREEDLDLDRKEAPGLDRDKPVESVKEVKVTFEEREFDVQLVDEGTDDTVISINGERYSFSKAFAANFRTDEGQLLEDGLIELAKDALSVMETDEFDSLALKSKKADETIDEALPKSSDITKGIKQLKKQLRQAVKDDDYTKASELSTRIQTLVAAVPELEEEPEKKDEPEAKEKPADEPEAKVEEPEAKVDTDVAVEEPEMAAAGVDEAAIAETTTWEELGWPNLPEATMGPDLTGWKIQDPQGRQYEITETDEKGLTIKDGDGSTKYLGYLGELSSGGAKLINPKNETVDLNKQGNFGANKEGKLPQIDKTSPDKKDSIDKLAEEKDAKAKARKDKIAKVKKEKAAKKDKEDKAAKAKKDKVKKDNKK